MPYIALADGRDYALFPRAASNPVPLLNNGKVYTKLSNGAVELFYQNDQGVVSRLTPSTAYSQAAVIWRPGVESVGGAVESWAEVQTLIALNLGAILVYLDPTFGDFHVPAGSVTDCFGATIFKTLNNTANNQFYIDDGAQLIGVAAFIGSMTVHCESTTIPSIVQNNQATQLREGTNLVQEAGATVSSIYSTGLGFGQVVCIEGAAMQNNAAIPMIDVVAGGFYILVNILGFGNAIPANILGGGAGGFAINFADSSAPALAQPAWLGGFQSSYLSQQLFTNPSAGDTASRPTAATIGVLSVGQPYFDTDLGIPIWYNGTNWVDATGTVV